VECRKAKRVTGMEDEGLVLKLKERRWDIGRSVMRDDGVMLWRINDVLMFRRDAVDLATGAATLEEVLVRNEGRVFPKAPPTDFQKFQARVFQEVTDMEDERKRRIVQDLVKAAQARGLTIDDLLRPEGRWRGSSTPVSRGTRKIRTQTGQPREGELHERGRKLLN